VAKLLFGANTHPGKGRYFMTLGLHEASELNELLLSCTNSINSMGFFLNQVKCQQLKSILQNHMAAHIQDYNMKVEWASKGQSTQKLQVPQMPVAAAATQSPNPVPCAPNPQTTALDDRAIATSYLLTLKRAGREYAWATFETTDPQLRSFLEDAFQMCSRHAFEVGQYMISKGYYPITAVPQAYMSQLSGTYQPVKEPAMVH
jgi:spore coat protein CotF